MRLIIAGGRDRSLSESDFERLDKLRESTPVDEVVSGGAPGVDTHGEFWARSRGIPVARFPADWLKQGKAAGPIRNRKMAEHADAVVLFPGGNGTENMFAEAQRFDLDIYDWR